MTDYETDDQNGNGKALLTRFARIDERTKAIQEDLRNFRADVKLAVDAMIERVREVEFRENEKMMAFKKSHEDLIDHIDKNFVKKESFNPIQHLVYGFVALVITAVLAAVFSLVIIVK